MAAIAIALDNYENPYVRLVILDSQQDLIEAGGFWGSLRGD
jgi:hypothetical protein